MAEKRKAAGESAPRCRTAGTAGKTKILDEYPALPGGNRTYAICKRGGAGAPQLRLIDGRYVNVRVSGGNRRKRVYARCYDGAVLLQFFRCICGERPAPLKSKQSSSG